MASDINLLPQLPAEIIEFQILSRLPVKSLIRFQSVCKSWKLLISNNPYFVNTHLHNSNYNSLILRLCTSSDWGGGRFKLRASTKIIGCINGLVCFYNWRTGCLKELVGAIWNPATRQCVKIPALIDKTASIPYCVGFGFDSVANDYKIIYVTTIEGQPLQGFIYSYNPDRWKKIAPSNFLYYGTIRNPDRPARVDESIYWLNQVGTSFTVISFDVRRRIFRLLPDSVDHEESEEIHVTLLNMRDSVALIFYDATLCLGSTIDVHIFNEKRGEWNKMCIGPFIGQEPAFLPVLRLLTCFPNGDLLFAGAALKLYRVSADMRTIKSLKGPEKKENEDNYYYFDSFTSESLIFLEGMEPWHDHREVQVFSLEKY